MISLVHHFRVMPQNQDMIKGDFQSYPDHRHAAVSHRPSGCIRVRTVRIISPIQCPFKWQSWVMPPKIWDKSLAIDVNSVPASVGHTVAG